MSFVKGLSQVMHHMYLVLCLCASTVVMELQLGTEVCLLTEVNPVD